MNESVSATVEECKLLPQRARVRVSMSDGRVFDLSDEVALGRVRVGESLCEQEIGELIEADTPHRIQEAAIHLLSYRARTKAEMRRRLLQKGFDEAAVDARVEDLEAHGYLDDLAFARSFVRDRVRLRGLGRYRIQQELRMRGVTGEEAQQSLDEVFADEGASEVEMARTQALRWKARPGGGHRRDRARLVAFLQRRGYGADTVRAVADWRLREGADGGTW